MLSWLFFKNFFPLFYPVINEHVKNFTTLISGPFTIYTFSVLNTLIILSSCRHKKGGTAVIRTMNPKERMDLERNHSVDRNSSSGSNW